MTGSILLFMSLLGNPSAMRLATPQQATFHSVQYFDQQIDLTNRVLDRTAIIEVAIVHHNKLTGEFEFFAAMRNKQAVQEHCKRRFGAERLPNGSTECGGGFKN